MAFDNIIGYEGVRIEFSFLQRLFAHRAVLSEHSVNIPCSLLLHGPAGRGKKFMASEFVRELGYDSFTFTPEEKCETQLENFIAWLDKADRDDDDDLHVICVHSLDRIAEMDGGNGSVMLRTFLDRDLNGSNLFVIATSDTIREGLPGYCCHDRLFERALFLDEPDLEDARAFLRHLVEKKKLTLGISEDDAAKTVTGISYAGLDSFLNHAVYLSLDDKTKSEPGVISREDFINTYFRQIFGSGDMSGDWDDAMRRAACHEAGHVLVGEALRSGCIGTAGIREGTGIPYRGLVSRCLPNETDGQSMAAYYLAGMAAEEHCFEGKEAGASSDIEKAMDVLRDYVILEGIKGLSAVSQGDPRNDSPVRKERQENAVDELMEEAYGKALEILSRNHETLVALTEALYERKFLFASDIREILGEHPFRQETS